MAIYLALGLGASDSVFAEFVVSGFFFTGFGISGFDIDSMMLQDKLASGASQEPLAAFLGQPQYLADEQPLKYTHTHIIDIQMPC